MQRLLILLIMLISLAGSLQAQQEPSYTLYFIGDAGDVSTDQKNPTLDMLRQRFDESDERAALIFLGDNIYPIGLPEKGNKYREKSIKSINAQLDVIRDFPGRSFMIPGNHDWKQTRPEGWEYVLRQGEYVENYLATEENVFLPDGGCPGPVEISLSDDLTLILVDTQWLLHPWDKPGEESDCDSKTPAEVFLEIRDILSRNLDKKVIVAGHHPIYTYGSHGGVATLKQHIFPLTELNDALYLPFPIIGSIYPAYRKYVGNIQDLSHPKYRAMTSAFKDLYRDFPNLIHLAGHEHNLQYILRERVHYIVSGSGSKNKLVKKKKDVTYAVTRKGFGELEFYDNGKVLLKMWVVEPITGEFKVDYEQELFSKTAKTPIDDLQGSTYQQSDQQVTMTASELYHASGTKEFFLGKNYRDVWSTPVEVEVFDIGKEKGGLKIIKRGGGQATQSLRLEAKDGRQYVLRSIDKDPSKAIPEQLRETFAANLVQDQISANHPYGAFVIPKLADAAGIYHTNPKLVYIPDDPRFGKYRTQFGDMLALFEERPDDDWSGTGKFGDSPDIESYSKVLEELEDDNDNEVDEAFVLRNRLFDLVIGDWDRHDDQWRWAELDKEDEKGKLYRPIPRDRDQAFFTNQGFLPKIVSRRWAMPKFEGFNPTVRWVEGFNFNARHFDRYFMTELSRDEWLAMADTIQNRLTDQVIEEAIRSWPDEIFDLNGEEMINTLKSRRDNLKEYTLDYYLFMAEEVTVLGSDKHEFFEVTRLNDEETQVTVYKTKKEGDIVKQIYQRTFNRSETDEIRLYGLGGNDRFEIEGEVDKGIKIRVIGGEDEDVILDQSQVSGWGKKTLVYDTRQGNTLQLGPEAKNLTSNRLGVNAYDRYAFKYNMALPLIYGTFNADDGIYLGLGTLLTTHGFRKDPYASRNLLLFKYAFRTNSFDTRYTGDFTDVFGTTDLRVSADIRIPSYVTNYFGLGNETENLAAGRTGEKDIDFYRARFEFIEISALMKSRVGQRGLFFIGPAYQSFELQQRDREDFFIYDFANNDLSETSAFNGRSYFGLSMSYEMDRRNKTIIPTTGMYFNLSSKFYKGLTNASNDLSKITGELAFYHSFRIPAKLTFATRIGGGYNFGDFEFFQANTLDGNSNLRGYRKTRFAGRSSFYNNFDLRLKLFSFKSVITPGSFGLVGFNDFGRVWVEDENSDKWHHGYGGGVWLSPLDEAVISFMLAFSEEESPLPLLKFGFLF